MNSTARGFVQLGSGATAAKCTDGTVVSTSTLTSLICNCPTYAVDIAPCICGAVSDGSSTLGIDCANKGLGDADMETIVKNIPATTPLSALNLQNNSLTRIPANLPQFTQLKNFIVSQNNISAVNENDVTLTANVTNLDLSSNKITKIAAKSLPGEIKQFRGLNDCLT